MNKETKRRYLRYLTFHYKRMESKKLDKKLNDIILRISSSGKYKKEIIESVIHESLKKGYKPYKITAMMDMVDIEDRM